MNSIKIKTAAIDINRPNAVEVTFMRGNDYLAKVRVWDDLGAVINYCAVESMQEMVTSLAVEAAEMHRKINFQSHLLDHLLKPL